MLLFPSDTNAVLHAIAYDPVSGNFTRRSKGKGCGRRAGCVKNDGYRYIGINGKMLPAHRLAWFIKTGAWPTSQIDHINGNRQDNRIANLREATCSENQWNRGPQKNCTSGHKGIDWFEPTGKWRARIKFHGKRHHLGCFEFIEDAVAAYKSAALSLHGKFARV